MLYGGLPAGTVPVGVGLGVFGVSSYVFLAAGARVLSAAQFGVLSVLWVMVYTGGPGVFLPFEQAIGRAVAAHRGDPAHERRAVRTLLAASVAALLVLLLVALAARPLITRRLLGGSSTAFVALLLATVGLWAAYVTRGIVAGHDRYGVYGAQLAVEGAGRVLVAVAVVALSASLGGFTLGLAAAMLLAVAVTAPAVRGGHRRAVTATVTVESPAGRVQLRILAWLILSGLMMQVLVNVAPVIAQLAPGQPPGAAGHYLGGLMLARLPLFLFAAVQAALLPGLAHTVADGDRAGLRRRLAGLFAIIGAGMGVFALVMAVAGPGLVTLVYGGGFRLHRVDLVLLVAGTGAAMLAMVAASAVVAVGAPAASAAGWLVAVAVLVAVLLLPGPLFLRLELSYLVGSLVALAVQLAALFHWVPTMVEAREPVGRAA